MINNYDRVCAIIDLDNILYNMNSICNKIDDNTSIYAVIKADGYGHGAIPIAREFENIDKVRGYAVATAEEAMQLINAGIKKEILVIGYTFSYAYSQMIEHDVRLTVFRKDTLVQLNDIAKQMGKKAIVHIKVDTGMGRIGVSPYDDGFEFVKEAIALSNIEVEGIFTHFARADEVDLSSAMHQYDLFRSFVHGVEAEFGFNFKVKHCSNSAAIARMNCEGFNAVRAGIIMYGMWPSMEVPHNCIDIKPVMRLISHITYIKCVIPGTPISYGGTFVANKPMIVATIPVGYADGYPRSLSNKAYVLIKGMKAKILGRVCMDQMMVDITEIPLVNEGDEVIIIGDSAHIGLLDHCDNPSTASELYVADESIERITMEDLATLSDHLNYELSCDIGKRVPRLFIKDGICVCSKDYFDDVPIVNINMKE